MLKSVNNLKNIMGIKMKQNESSLNDKNYSSNSTKHYQDEIDSLKEEIHTLKVINKKTNEYMQLELDSKLVQCKYKQEMIEQVKSENNSLKNDILNHEDIILKLSEKYDYANIIIKDMENEINKLNKKISAQHDKITSYEEEFALKNKIIDKNKEKINELTSNIAQLNCEKKDIILENKSKINELNRINKLLVEKDAINSDLILKLKEKDELIYEKERSIIRLHDTIDNQNKIVLDNENKIKNQEIILNNNKKIINDLNLIKRQYMEQLSTLDTTRYFIYKYKNEIKNKNLENEYLKNNNLVKKLLDPLSYIYLIFKSNPKEILVNLKLYNALKNSDKFDIGYYLRKNADIKNSKWYKYFSPQLHYVCKGFNEKRDINKSHLKVDSKKELLNYTYTKNSCD